MAAIEKVCDLTGEYPSWLMYGYKRNQLQIMPKCRKRFRGDGDTVYVQLEGLRWQYRWGGHSIYDKNEMDWYEPVFTSEKEFIKYKKEVERLLLVKKFVFAYISDTPELQGEVKGCYVNYTTDISAMRRKLKRLLRCKKLNVVMVDDLNSIIESR